MQLTLFEITLVSLLLMLFFKTNDWIKIGEYCTDTYNELINEKNTLRKK